MAHEVLAGMELIGFFVGTGLSLVSVGGSDDADLTGSLDVGASVRVTPQLGLGLHVRASHVEAENLGTGGACLFGYWLELDTLDVALAVQHPWTRGMAQLFVGGHFARGTSKTQEMYTYPDPPPPPTVDEIRSGPLFTIGVLVAYDVWQRAAHHTSLYVNAQATGSGAPGAYPYKFNGTQTDITIGVAYRRW